MDESVVGFELPFPLCRNTLDIRAQCPDGESPSDDAKGHVGPGNRIECCGNDQGNGHGHRSNLYWAYTGICA